jgi:predicted HTH domain antitoxin
MHTLTPEEMTLQPQRVLDDAQRGEASIVMNGSVAVLLAVPLGEGLDAPEVRIELAVRLFDRDQISLGTAARIAGLSYSEMIDEMGRRQVPVVRYSQEELATELDYVRTLVGS